MLLRKSMNWSIRQAAFCSVLDTSLKDSLFSSKTMHVFDMSFDRIKMKMASTRVLLYQLKFDSVLKIGVKFFKIYISCMILM